MLHSNRKYKVYAVERGTDFFDPKMPLGEILAPKKEDETEMHYALQDRIDDVLDLKKNESMYFTPNRDNAEAFGIITRIR